MHFTIGTRSSKLAVWQAEHIAQLLQMAGHTTSMVLFETAGDKKLETSISKIGSKGVFTEELEIALLNGSIDLAVHSAKDLQSTLPEGLHIIAYTEREQAHDVVVSYNPEFRLATAEAGAIVGSSSTRRRAILIKNYPHLKLVEMRGNLQTRFKKLEAGEAEAMLLAFAGVKRMGLENFIVENLPLDVFIPPAGQASIALEVAKSLDAEKQEMLTSVCNHEASAKAISMERSFLQAMDGGCSIPVFAHAKIEGETIHFVGGISSLDGKDQIMKDLQLSVTNPDLDIQAKELAIQVLNSGGATILQEIRVALNN